MREAKRGTFRLFIIKLRYSETKDKKTQKQSYILFLFIFASRLRLSIFENCL